MKELCPFCGSDELEVIQYGPDSFEVECRRCHASGPTGTTEQEAERRWDDRAVGWGTCPFCGSDDIDIITNWEDGIGWTAYNICNKCYAHGPTVSGRSRDAAIKQAKSCFMWGCEG